MFRRLLCGLALVVFVSCGGNDDPGVPSATIAPSDTPKSTTTSTTEAMTPEEEVEAAYLRSWEVYAEAMLELDPSRYREVYADEALALRLDELERLKAANTPARMKVEHDYTVTILAPDRAVVVDVYRNHSVTLDPETHEPAEPDPNNLLKRQYDMRKEGNRWLVVRVSSLP